MALAIIETEGDGKTIKITDQYGNNPMRIQVDATDYEILENKLQQYAEEDGES
jgi:hypothetical protein